MAHHPCMHASYDAHHMMCSAESLVAIQAWGRGRGYGNPRSQHGESTVWVTGHEQQHT